MNENAHILVVDGDPHLLRTTSRVLKKADYEVLEAGTGTEGLRLAKAQRPNLIVLDAVLPDIDSIEVCRRVKEEPALAGCLVLFLSGVKTSSDDQASGLEAGADEYITRPISDRELLARVEAMLRIKQVEKELRNALTELTVIHQNVPVAMMLVDRDRRVRKVNGAASLFAGRPEEEMLGLRAGEALRCLHHLDDPQGCGFGPACVTCTVRLAVLDTFATRENGRDVEAWLSLPRGDSVEERCLLVSTAYLQMDDTEQVLVCAQDITDRKRVENIMQARLHLLEFASSHSTDKFLTATLDEIEALTRSSIGFYHFLEADQRTLSLQNWSTHTLKTMCTAEGKGSHYDVAQAGVWADCVYERRPVIHNDYASLPHRKGMPEGHAPVVREVVVPIFRGELIKAIIGVGNKPTPYNESDIEIVSQLGDLSWDITERKRAEEALQQSEQRKAILNQIANIFLTVPDNEMYAEVLAVVLRAMKSEFGIFGFIEANNDLVIPSLTRGIWDECQVPDKSIVFPPDTWEDSLWGRAIREKRAFYSDGPFHTPAGHIHIDNFLTVPIVFGNETIGLISCADSKQGYTEESKDLLEDIAGHISPILNARLQRDRQEQERKQAEEAYRASVSRFAELFNKAAIPLCFAGKEGETLHFNAHFEKTFGYSHEEVPTINEWWQLAYPDPAYREWVVDTCYAAIQRAVDTESDIEPIEYRVTCKNGDIRTMVVYGSFIGDELLLTFFDITERKQAEQERQAHLRFLESMDQVNRAIQGTNDLEQMMSDVLDAMLTIFACDRAFLMYPCDPEAATWRVPMERNKPEYPGAQELGLEMPMDADVAETLRLLLAADGPVKFGPGTPHPLPADVAEQFGFRCFMSMALHPKVGKPWQFGIHQCSYPRLWTPEEERLFQEVGRRLTDALTSLLVYRDLQESELRYREIFENSSDVIVIAEVTKDGHFRLLDFNPAWETIIGLSRTELVGRFLKDLSADETARTVLEQYHVCLEKKIPIDFETGLATATGHWYLHTTLIPVSNAAGNIYRLVGVSRNITERKRAEEALRTSEERLQLALDAAQMGQWDWNIVTGEVVWSPKCLAIYGLPPDTPMSYERFLQALHPEDRERIDAALRRAVEDRASYDELKRTIWPDGSIHWTASRGQAYCDATGQPIRMIGVTFDITERKEAEEELRAHRDHLEELVRERTAELIVAKERAEAASQAKSAFLANMSHELRTPLNAILGYAQILQRRPLDSDVINALNTIQRSGEHLLTLINDILDIARIEAGRQELVPTSIHFPGFLEHIASIIRSRAETKGLTFTFEKLGAIPVGVQADETRLRQVLLNLLDNAVKFTDAGHVTLRVKQIGDKQRMLPQPKVAPSQQEAAETVRSFTGSPARLRFEVEDTGIGIPPDQVERIFQPFEQVRHATRWSSGTGLGLAISHQLVRLMGGDLQVESKVGRGSTFWFEIVLPVTEMAVGAVQSPERTITGYRGPRRTVLVVDDVPSSRAILVDLLQPLGFEVIEAADGQQALHLAQELRPDLILMDRWMPVTDGLEATRRMRQIPELTAVPVVAVSASVSKEDQTLSQEAGINAFLPKPVSWPRLAALLQECLALEWEYEKTIEVGEKEDEAMLMPPPEEEMVILLNLARRGDMRAIQERTAYIVTLSEQYVPFARRLRELAKGFEEKQIRALMERYMEEDQ